MSLTRLRASNYTYFMNSYLRALGAYQGVKKGYVYCRGFVGIRTIAPIVEWVAEVRDRDQDK